MADSEQAEVSRYKTPFSCYLSALISFLVVLFGFPFVFLVFVFLVPDQYEALSDNAKSVVGWGVTIVALISALVSARGAFLLSKKKAIERNEIREGKTEGRKRWGQRSGIMQVFGGVLGLGIGAVAGYFSTHDHSFGATLGGFFGFLGGFFLSAIYFSLKSK